jgi:hypothetical protein
MPKIVHTTSDPFRAYATAHRKCLRLSGHPLNAAQDEERDALEAISQTPAPTLADIAAKIDLLISLMQTDWTDSRDVRLLDSIRRDLQALERRAA